MTARLIGAVFSSAESALVQRKYLGFLPYAVERYRFDFVAERDFDADEERFPLDPVGFKVYRLSMVIATWFCDEGEALSALIGLESFIPSLTVLRELLKTCEACGVETTIKESPRQATVGPHLPGFDNRSFHPLLCRACWTRETKS